MFGIPLLSMGGQVSNIVPSPKSVLGRHPMKKLRKTQTPAIATATWPGTENKYPPPDFYLGLHCSGV